MASTTTVKALAQPAQLTTTAAARYTAPANTTALIKKVTVTNTSAAVVTVTVYKVPSGGSVGASNTIVSSRSVPVNQDLELYSLANHVLQSGDSIYALASAATALTLAISGVEIV